MVYMCQVQWYMLVKGMRRWDVASFFLLQDQFRKYTITAQDWFQDAMIDEAARWWEKHIIQGEPPEIGGTKNSGDWLISRHPTGEGVRDATEDEIRIMEEIISLKQQEKRLSDHRATAENALKSRIGESERIQFGKIRATWKAQTSRRLDTKKLTKENPQLAEKYRKESITRVLRVEDKR